MKRIAWLIAVLALASGCAPWTAVGGKYVESSENYEADLPNGWKKENLNRNFLRITKDGIGLQQIAVGRWSVDKDLPHTKRKFSPGMLPQEVADLVIDDFRSDNDRTDYEVVDNSPAKVGGHSGFKITYTYRTKAGLKKKGSYYGALLDKWYYYCMFDAPAMYYFSKDYETFEKVKESLRISKSG